VEACQLKELKVKNLGSHIWNTVRVGSRHAQKLVIVNVISTIKM
jgi:hypothetical protein